MHSFTARMFLGALALALVLPAMTAANDGDDTLQMYLNKSDVVALGEFTTEPFGISSEAGVVHYGADFKIIKLVKGEAVGSRRVGGTIRVSVVRFELGLEDRPPELQKGRKCILFLKSVGRKPDFAYVSADPWFGIQRPVESLVWRLEDLVKSPRQVR